MRFWFTYLIVSSLLVAATSGCQTFQQSRLGALSPRKSLLGLNNKNKRSVDPDEMLDPLGARDSNRILLDDLSPSQLATTMKTRFQGGVDEAAARKHYDEGQRLYQAGIAQRDAGPDASGFQDLFSDAANEFRLASATWPDSEIEESALYFEGESYFFADRYVQSNRALEKLIVNYSGTRYLDMAENRRYAIAVYWLQLSEKSNVPSLTDPKRPKTSLAAEARRVLHQIKIDDPTGKLADDATLALGKAFMHAHRYYEAADTFEDLRQNYPGSEHQFTAHMLELQARLAGYQGKDYDDTPLLKADAIMKSIVRQFPQQAESELEYLEKQSQLILSQLAERDYTMGQYFEKRGENLAAKLYYEKVADQINDSEMKETLDQQIAEVASKPDRPGQHAEWLVNMFPNPESERPAILTGNNETIFR